MTCENARNWVEFQTRMVPKRACHSHVEFDGCQLSYKFPFKSSNTWQVCVMVIGTRQAKHVHFQADCTSCNSHLHCAKSLLCLQQCLNNSTPCSAAVMQGTLPRLSQAQRGAFTQCISKQSETKVYNKVFFSWKTHLASSERVHASSFWLDMVHGAGREPISAVSA